MKDLTAAVLSDFCNLELVERLYFLKWIKQYHECEYDYCGIPDSQAVYYQGPLREEQVKKMDKLCSNTD